MNPQNELLTPARRATRLTLGADPSSSREGDPGGGKAGGGKRPAKKAAAKKPAKKK